MCNSNLSSRHFNSSRSRFNCRMSSLLANETAPLNGEVEDEQRLGMPLPEHTQHR